MAKELIYGTMGLGGSWDIETPITDEHQQIADTAFSTAIESGISFIDLADIYTRGKSERVLGSYLKRNPGLREKLTIQSKCGIKIDGADFGSRFDFSYDYILKSVENILKRLEIDCLDILLLHRPDPLVHKSEIKKAFDHLFDNKMIKNIGVSNMDYHQIELLEFYTDRKIYANQLQLSLEKCDFVLNSVGFNNSCGDNLNFPLGTIEHAIKNNISIQAWSPLAGGIYSGKESKAEDPRITDTTKIVTKIAEKYKVSKDAIVLAWLLKHPANIKPVIGTTNPQRIKNSVESLNIDITSDEWYELLVASSGLRMP